MDQHFNCSHTYGEITISRDGRGASRIEGWTDGVSAIHVRWTVTPQTDPPESYEETITDHRDAVNSLRTIEFYANMSLVSAEFVTRP